MAKKTDILVKCTRCRHQCMESRWRFKAIKSGGEISASQLVCPKCGCKTYYDMRLQVAWCWASGLIETGDKAPANDPDGTGPIVFAQGPKSELQVVLGALSRHGQGASAGKLLVPGVPEASNQHKAADALIAWTKWCMKGNGRKGRYGVEFFRLGV